MDSLDLVRGHPYMFKYKRRNLLVSEGMLPKDLDALQHFEMRPTDIFLITYPKSGQLLALIPSKGQSTISQDDMWDPVQSTSD